MDYDFGPIMDASIAPYTIGFLCVDSGIPHPFGSGTLVKCKHAQGILTCAHVLEEIEAQTEIGIVLFPVVRNKFQKITLDVSTITSGAIKFYKNPPTEDGPDLAFIPLSIATMSSFSASASILCLDIGKNKISQSKPENTEVIEVISGVVGELTPPIQINGNKRVLKVEGLMNVGKLISTKQSKEFDLLTFEPIPGKEFPLPSTYKGTSGGGVWRIYVQKKNDETYALVETRLIGVAFWETDPPHRQIKCHGPESIYNCLLDKINKQWS